MTPERKEYIEWMLRRGGGMITTGNHLGVFVSDEKNLGRCPPGWVFVDVSSATVEKVSEAIDVATQGRRDWPKNAKEDKKEEE